ncbi:MAG: hypothetical protein WCF10_15640 [Polyangiales bacterium]
MSEVRDSLVPGGQLLVVDLALASGPIHARAYPGVFEGLVKALTESGAHHTPEALTIQDAMSGRDPIIGFGYDWRREIASEVQRLHEVIVAASEERRLRTGNPRIDIVAHSMGTQLVRWYLQYGTAPVPSDGSLPELTWAGVRYLERVVWADNGEAVDIYDAALWEALHWGPFADDQDEALRALLPEVATRSERLALLRKHMAACLEHARRFHEALDRPAGAADDHLAQRALQRSRASSDGGRSAVYQPGSLSPARRPRSACS